MSNPKTPDIKTRRAAIQADLRAQTATETKQPIGKADRAAIDAEATATTPAAKPASKKD